jgi:hypothetical protein
MRRLLIALIMTTVGAPGAIAQVQSVDEEQAFEVRARPNLFFGTGVSSNERYYDVPITDQPSEGVLIKLPYTQKGGKLTFDVHHRVAMSEDFGLPAEIMTVIEVLTGGTNHLGTYTLLDDVGPDARPAEEINRASDAEIDRLVTPLVTKTIEINTDPGPQSISIVGRDLNISRSGRTTLIDTPGTRIAMVSNITFETIREGTPLSFGDPD